MSSCTSERTFLGFPNAAAESADRGGHAGCYCGGGGGGGAPLDLCTEGLGFESGDGRVGADEAELDEIAAAAASAAPPRTPAAAAGEKEGRRAFPPPLRWMGEGSGAYMRAERRDGRLILREVRIERPEVFHASREDGRLRLRLIGSDGSSSSDDDDDSDEEEECCVVRSVSGGGREGFRRCTDAVGGGNDGGDRILPWWSSHRCVTMA